MKEQVGKVFKSKEGLQLVHQNFSAACFNKVWDYIDKENLSDDDIENMIATCYTSLWHWKQREDCKNENLSIAYWQLGRVHCLAKKSDTANDFGLKCLKVSQDLDPFSLGYAYELLLNAAILKGNKTAATEYLKSANEQLALITDEESKSYLKKDLETSKKRL